MDMRSIMQLPRNVVAGMKFKWGGTSVFPSIEISGQGLLDLHGDNIWLVSNVGPAFLKCRIFWEDCAHEFKFLPLEKRGEVCQKALENCAAMLRQAIANTPGKSAAHLAFVDSLVALEARISNAAKGVIVNLDDYNSWVRETGGGGDELMSEREHYDDLIADIKQVRKDSYPLWASLIALLPPGSVKSDAEARFKEGCKSAGLDSGEVLADWEPVPEDDPA